MVVIAKIIYNKINKKKFVQNIKIFFIIKQIQIRDGLGR